MNRRNFVLGIPLAALMFSSLLFAQSPPSFQPEIYLDGSAVRESVDSDDPSIITGTNFFSFDDARLNDDGTVSGRFQ